MARPGRTPPQPDPASPSAGLEVLRALAVTEPLKAVDREDAPDRRMDRDGARSGGERRLSSRRWADSARLAVLAINGINVVVLGLLIQIILVGYVGMGYITSYIVQTAVLVQLCFLMTRYIAGRTRNQSFLRAFARFNVQQLAVTGLAIGVYAGLERSGMKYIAANATVTAALTPVSLVVGGRRLAGERAGLRRRVATIPWPLFAVLAIQAVLSLRLVWSNTAFQDEALYLWAGHLEIAHWLHGTSIPALPTYFSGAPVIYPPLAALADSIGGLAAARLLSLAFMLCATSLLWSTVSRLYGRRPAFFAAALFVGLGPSIQLGAFATYDAMSLCLVAVSAWCVARAGETRDETKWMALAAAALVLANATKYASALFDPVVVSMAILTGFPRPGGKYAVMRGAALGAYVTAGLILLLTIGGGYYVAGVEQTTLTRSAGDTPFLLVLETASRWVGLIAVIAWAGALAYRKFRPDDNLRVFLPGLFAFAALLAPLEQARIHTLTSLDKHVDFGAWFAAISAGVAVELAVSLLRPKALRITAVGACAVAVAVFAPAELGFSQAQSLFAWPNSYSLIAALAPLIDNNSGAILVEIPSVPEYYLPAGSQWWRWSSTRTIVLPDRHSISVPVGAQGNPDVYAHYITIDYFSVVALDFQATPRLDYRIFGDLMRNHAYSEAAVVPYGHDGRFIIWVLDSAGHGT